MQEPENQGINEQQPWHRLFALSWVDFFPGLPPRDQQEGQIMPDMLEDFARETIEQLLKSLPVKKRLEGLTTEQILEGLKELPPETVRELAEKLKGNGASAQPE
jgi:hypothetical protein